MRTAVGRAAVRRTSFSRGGASKLASVASALARVVGLVPAVPSCNEPASIEVFSGAG